MSRFKDKVILITGAARGIGLATATRAAHEGAHTVLCDLNPEALDAATESVASHGNRPLALAGDVTDFKQVHNIVDSAMNKYGRIDVLINNAATTSYYPAELLPEEDWRRVLEVGLTSTFFVSQMVAKASMIPARNGAIVNLGSGAGMAGLPRCAGYVAAKHGVVGLTKALAVDWGQFNIRVNCVCPGLTFTDLAKSIATQNPQMMREREQRIPLGRGAQPEDIANSILFLASSDADAISGSILAVDGGTTAMSSGYSPPRAG